MSDTEINLAIAESGVWQRPSPPYHLIDAEMSQPLDYCNDLNAMIDPIKSFTDSEWTIYHAHLVKIVGGDIIEGWDFRPVVEASARHRAEAFLRALGKWKE